MKSFTWMNLKWRFKWEYWRKKPILMTFLLLQIPCNLLGDAFHLGVKACLAVNNVILRVGKLFQNWWRSDSSPEEKLSLSFIWSENCKRFPRLRKRRTPKTKREG